MILNTTSDYLKFVLSANVQTRQLSFTMSVNSINTNTNVITPNTVHGTSNNTTFVDLITSPSANQIYQIKDITIYNNDTQVNVVTIHFDDTATMGKLPVYMASLNPGDQIQYTLENGWSVLDNFGQKKFESTNIYPSGGIRMAELLVLPNASTSTAIGTNSIIWTNLGKAEFNYSAITLCYRLTASASTVTWAELAIYRVAQPMGIGTQQALQRLGFISTNNTTGWTGSLDIKQTRVPVSNVKKGDDLYAVFGNVATVSAAFRGGGISEPLLSILHGINTAASTWRPSQNEMLLATTFQGAACDIWVAWQGY